jgi:hypothetical protein
MAIGTAIYDRLYRILGTVFDPFGRDRRQAAFSSKREQHRMIDYKTLERRVMADQNRPCLYGVNPPCVHPKCLESHYKTLKEEEDYRILNEAAYYDLDHNE